MIQVDSLPSAYRGIVRSSSHELASDAPVAKGGGGMGFGAHGLLEASLAACLNMAVRMHADQKGIPLEHVSTRVTLSWPDAQVSKFEYSVDLTGPLSAEQCAELHAIDGQLLFVEHGLAPEEPVRRWQNRLTPVWKRIGGGCHLNRPIRSFIENAGFAIAQIETGYMKGPRPMTFMYEGRAAPRP